jgi:hypothetical protein
MHQPSPNHVGTRHNQIPEATGSNSVADGNPTIIQTDFLEPLDDVFTPTMASRRPHPGRRSMEQSRRLPLASSPLRTVTYPIVDLAPTQYPR